VNTSRPTVGLRQPDEPNAPKVMPLTARVPATVGVTRSRHHPHHSRHTRTGNEALLEAEGPTHVRLFWHLLSRPAPECGANASVI
jgi:hypothetical protein